MSQVNNSQRLGIITAAIHIIESDLQIQAATPETKKLHSIAPAVMIAFNALEQEDQILIAKRLVQVLQEQQVKLTQK